MEKEPPIVGGKIVGCVNCGYKPEVASMDMVIAAGFGDAYLKKNGEIVWEEENKELHDCIRVRDAEEMAAKDPDNDWRFEIIGPLSEVEYQRHDKGKWVLIRTGQGFA